MVTGSDAQRAQLRDRTFGQVVHRVRTFGAILTESLRGFAFFGTARLNSEGFAVLAPCSAKAERPQFCDGALRRV